MRYLVPVSQRRSLEVLSDRLDFTIGDTSAKKSAFWVMLTLSGVIATSGVAGDSTAMVIGAMIVAPLSTPILGVGLGIATGRAGLVGRSLSLVLAGIILVVVLGYVSAHFIPNPASMLSNSQVLGRTSPTLNDLVAAMATGLVGAVAVTRHDVGDVLPGVAIAISLVPPLAVAGVCLGSDAPALALGAFVLFGSNALAMIIMGTVILVATGYGREAGVISARHRRAYATMGVALALVAIPMTGNTLAWVWAGQISSAAKDWLAETPGAEVIDVSLNNTATVDVRAPGKLPPAADLQESVDALVPWKPKVVVVHTVGSRISQ